MVKQIIEDLENRLNKVDNFLSLLQIEKEYKKHFNIIVWKYYIPIQNDNEDLRKRMIDLNKNIKKKIKEYQNWKTFRIM